MKYINNHISEFLLCVRLNIITFASWWQQHGYHQYSESSKFVSWGCLSDPANIMGNFMWHLKRGKKRIDNFKLIQNLTLLLKGEKTKVSTKVSVNRNQDTVWIEKFDGITMVVWQPNIFCALFLSRGTN